MEKSVSNADLDWLQPLKKKIIFSLLGILVLSIVITMIGISVILRECLLDDSRLKTQELGSAIESSLDYLMTSRDPNKIQLTLDGLKKSGSSITRVFIINRSGKVAYSTDREEVGRLLDRFADPSCLICHTGLKTAPPESTVIMKDNGQSVQRNIRVIYNRPACHGCHQQDERINGKLIIDRSLQGTNRLITSIILIIAGSGLICLIVVMPLLSKMLTRGMNQYIAEIVRQHSERTLLYMMMERLSKTIDMIELQHIIIEITGDTFGADEICMVTSRDGKEHKTISWAANKAGFIRIKIPEGGELFSLMEDWTAGRISDEKISDDRRQIAMPIAKGNRRFALIIARKNDQAFDPERLKLIKAMSSHVAVALENAFLYYMAITDELTQLYSQRHFRSIIGKEFAEFEQFGKKISLLMIDLDNFKKVNDSFGHVAGDHVLREVAGRVRSSVRDNDLVFRYGGEEFAVILPSTDIQGGAHVAERIRNAVRDAVLNIDGASLHVTVSIGVATCPDNALTIKDLILTADSALYKAKHTGKDCVVASDTLV